jgi:hypothetical protein
MKEKPVFMLKLDKKCQYSAAGANATANQTTSKTQFNSNSR